MKQFAIIDIVNCIMTAFGKQSLLTLERFIGTEQNKTTKVNRGRLN